MPSGDWRRLRVLGCWAAAAGHPVRTLTRAVSFDAAGVLTISVPSARWATDLTPHLETLRARVGTLSGERVVRIVLRVGSGESGQRS
jgi:predicted nucleic acid-binding Zn ribbon protein